MPRTRDGYIYDGEGVSAGLPTHAVVESSNPHDVKSKYDVIVIGAGFAGLVAVRDLARNHQLTVLLLEARDRIGGRTWTTKAWGRDIEMGGTWFHWSQPNIYAELQRHGLQRYLKTTAGTLAPDQYFFKPHGEDRIELDVQQSDAELERFATEFFTVDGLSPRELMPWPHDPWRPQPWTKLDHLSVRDRLNQIDQPDEIKSLFEAHMTLLGSASAEQTAFVDALRWFVLGGAGESMAVMYWCIAAVKFGNGGMTNFARHILAEFKGERLFNKAVSSIQQDDSDVLVSCSDGSQFSAERVVCSVPWNCLSSIQFNPPLSNLRQEAIRGGQMNKGAKVTFVLDEVQRNWHAVTPDIKNSDFMFAFVDREGPKSEQEDGTVAIAFGFNGKLEDPSQHDKVISEFKKLQPKGNVRGYVSHAWANDPYSKGVWYCGSPGMTTKYLREMQQPHGRITFANADWAHAYRGYVDGAIEQGSMAASYTAKEMSLFPSPEKDNP